MWEYTCLLEKEQANPVLIDFYECFIRDLETKINYFKYARMVVAASKKFATRQEANAFLLKIKDRLGIDKEAQLLLHIEMAGNLLADNKMVEAGDMLAQLKGEIDKCTSEEPLLFSGFYRSYALYFERRQEHEEFYGYALQFLAYTPSTTLQEAEKIEWAVRMGMAAIRGKKIYNIGELIEKDILKSLTKTTHVWLYDLLQAFNAARVKDFYRALELYRANIMSIPEIHASVEDMTVKIRIMALLDLIFSRQKEERNLSFDIIAQVSDIKPDEVEWLVMKAMSLGLIKGEIDEIEHIVKVTWMKPRVIDTQRIQIMRDTLQKWIGKVHKNLKELEEKTQGLTNP